jgi:hypothetical protein
MTCSLFRLSPLLLGASLLAACSADNTGPGATLSQVRLGFASRATSTPSASAASLDITSPTPGTFTDGTNTLVLSKVQLVLRKIELRRVNATVSGCIDMAVSADAGSGEAEPGDDHGHDGEAESGDDHGHDGVDDDCEEAEVGPVLFDVPVNSTGVKQSISILLDAGSYNAIEFKIHKAEAPEDQPFLAANPSFAGKSIHVEGSWNGTNVTFDTDLDADEELALQPPLTLSADGAADVTILVDLHTWFADRSGGLVNPASANRGQPNAGLATENIQRSFHAFEDENEDGRDDHGTD